MVLNGVAIGLNEKPYIVAELSGNHNRSLEQALMLIDIAKDCGANAVKLQTYTADTLTIDCDKPDFMARGIWKGRTLYQLYQESNTPWEWHKEIFDHCQKAGVTCFSTPFDISSVEFLENLNTPFYKIASFENADYRLLECVAQTGKPIIMSTGMITLAELEGSVNHLYKCGCKELVLLKCTSAYPAQPKEANLMTIPDMRRRFGCEVGLSDHTLGVGVALAAVSLGATVIEKHFTISRAAGGVDAAFSMEPAELKMLVKESANAWAALGNVSYTGGAREEKSFTYRRSLYIVKDMKAGDTITAENMRSIRPGYGLAPKFYDEIIGKTVTCDIERGTALKWEMVE